jgi:hypothetical protein
MLVFLLQISFENRNSYVVNRSFKKKPRINPGPKSFYNFLRRHYPHQVQWVFSQLFRFESTPYCKKTLLLN